MKLPAQLKQNELVAWFRITDVSKGLFSLVDREMRGLGLSRAQWFLLASVYYYENSTQQELADFMDISKSSTAKLIRKVEKKGWVRRENDSKDGRIYRVSVTPEMRPAIQAVAKLARAAVGGPLSALSAADMKNLLKVMKKIEDVLEQGSSAEPEMARIRPEVRKVFEECGIKKAVRRKKSP